ncbi:MAG TPA: hypothetical protein VGL89_03265, partial [Candidatus Koribacter sp.]
HWKEVLGRYRFVRGKLINREKNQTLLSRTVLAVIAAIIDAGYPESSVTVSTKYLMTHPKHAIGVTEMRNPELWAGLGKLCALGPETQQIAKRIHEGCVLANSQLLPPMSIPATVDEVLAYLGFPQKARSVAAIPGR